MFNTYFSLVDQNNELPSLMKVFESFYLIDNMVKNRAKMFYAYIIFWPKDNVLNSQQWKISKIDHHSFYLTVKWTSKMVTILITGNMGNYNK